MSMTAEQWNEAHPVGTAVTVYPGVLPHDPLAHQVREQQKVGAEVSPGDLELVTGLNTVTRRPAWTLGHGEPVVSVEGYTGGISLRHVFLRVAEESA
ncbi:hypothetical protein ACFW9I_02655 [[Kitasatospora] papulosa]|uniref:hypothetical protein n=1 Tax=[Kitasatospora] papulosa TaxID=1464011 RepID=UPI0036D1B8C5